MEGEQPFSKLRHAWDYVLLRLYFEESELTITGTGARDKKDDSQPVSSLKKCGIPLGCCHTARCAANQHRRAIVTLPSPIYQTSVLVAYLILITVAMNVLLLMVKITAVFAIDATKRLRLLQARLSLHHRLRRHRRLTLTTTSSQTMVTTTTTSLRRHEKLAPLPIAPGSSTAIHTPTPRNACLTVERLKLELSSMNWPRLMPNSRSMNWRNTAAAVGVCL